MSDRNPSAKQLHNAVQPLGHSLLYSYAREFDVKKWIPYIGVFSTGFWGIASIYEYKIHSNEIVPPASKAFLKYRIIHSLARSAPIFTLMYGASNTTAALANGYSSRGLAFATFTSLSLLALPFIWKDTSYSVLLGRVKMEIAKLEKGVLNLSEEETNRKLSALFEEGKNYAKRGLKYRRVTQFYNSFAVVGVLLGGFVITKTAQSTPGLLLEKTNGSTLGELIEGGKYPPLAEVLSKNFDTELDYFLFTLGNTVSYLSLISTQIKGGITAALHPSEEHLNEHFLTRLSKPVFEGHLAPLMYSWACAGRFTYALFSLVTFFSSLNPIIYPGQSVFENFLNKIASSAHPHPPQTHHHNFISYVHRPYNPLPYTEGQTAFAKAIGRSMNFSLLVGQLSGTVSAFFTKFYDWPALLSIVYRSSALPYAASGLMGVVGVKTILGLNAPALAKVGAFVQGTCYFANLTVHHEPHHVPHAGDDHNNLEHKLPEVDLLKIHDSSGTHNVDKI